MKQFFLILKIGFPIAIFAFLLSACAKTELTNIDGIEANPTVAFPLGKTSFGLSDFLKTNPILKVTKDSSLELVLSQDNVVSYSSAELVAKVAGDIRANFTKNYSLKELKLGNFAQNASVKLNDFASSFSDPMKSLLQNGGTTATAIPAFSQNTNITRDFTPFSEFESLSLNSGSLNITIGNNFVFDVQQLKIEILDRANANALGTTLGVGNLAAGEIKTLSADLANKSFSNRLAYRIPVLSSPGIAAGKSLDNAQSIGFSVSSKDLKFKNAKAKIAAQDFVNETFMTEIGGKKPITAKIKEMTIKSAMLNYSFTNTAKVNAKITMIFPTLKESGIPLTRVIDLQGTNTSGAIPLNNVLCDLGSDVAQPYNRLPSIIKVVLIPISAVTEFSETDEIRMDNTLTNVVIANAKGDFGTFEVDIPTKIQDFPLDLSLLSPNSQKLLFSNPTFKMRYSNSFGFPIEAKMDINASGTLGNENLKAPAFEYNYPTLAQLGQSVRDSFEFSDRNSNIKNFLGVVPNKISTSGKIKIAPKDNRNINFFTENSTLSVGLDLRIPIKFAAENIEMRNRIDGIQNTENLDKIESATLKIQYKNDFPLTTTMDIATINNGVEETIISNVKILAASDLDNFGKTKTAVLNATDIVLSQDQLRKLLTAKEIVTIGHVRTTQDGATSVALYSTYRFEIAVSLIAKMKLKY
jgi:hypothetical protein